MTYAMRNTLTVSFLSACTTAVYSTCPLGCKGVSAIFAYGVFTLFETLSPFYIHCTHIALLTVIAKLHTVNPCEIYPFTTLADDPPDGCILGCSAGNLQIPDVFQFLLIFVFIFSVCHFYILLC